MKGEKCSKRQKSQLKKEKKGKTKKKRGKDEQGKKARQTERMIERKKESNKE